MGTVQTVSLIPLLDDKKDGEDDGKRTWYAEPKYIFTRHTVGRNEEIKGTFRSPHCERIGIFSNSICSHCAMIPKFVSFRRRALLRAKRTAESGSRNIQHINNSLLTDDEIQQKLQAQIQKIEELRSTIFSQESAKVRQKLH